MQIGLPEVTTAAALEEKKKLQKGLGYLDMIFFTSAALIGLDTLGAFSANGSQALTWLLFSAITFLMPYGLLTAELGSTFTKEGGVYEWCKLAGGRFYAALTAMLYWISNPLWIGGTLAVSSIAAIKTFWFGSTSYQFGGTKLSDALIAANEVQIARRHVFKDFCSAKPWGGDPRGELVTLTRHRDDKARRLGGRLDLAA